MESPIDKMPIHSVGAFYPTEQAARYALARLEQAGFSRKQIYLLGNPAPKVQGIPSPTLTEVSSMDDFLAARRANLLQAGAGAEAGLANAASVVSKNVRVYAAKPVRQILLALGYDSNLLGLAEESRKTVEVTEDEFSQLVRDILKTDHWAVVVQPEGARKAQQALDLLSMVHD
jgi:hypothetical protein